MRRWLIILGILVALLAAGAVLAALNVNRFIDRNRDRISAQAEAAIGRKVAFGDVGVSFSGGLGIRVEDVRVGDDPSFSDQDFVMADAVDVRIAILPALLGRIELGRIVLRSPSIRVIQTKAGLSTDSLGGAEEAGTDAAADEDEAPTALAIALVDIQDGNVLFRDETARPPLDLKISQLDFTASEIGFDDPVSFELAAALLGADSQNLDVSGTVGPLAAESPNVELALRLDALPTQDLLRLGPVAEAVGPELSASGPLNARVDLAGTLAKLRFDAKLDAGPAAVRYGESFDKAPGVPLELSAVGEQTEAAIVFETLAITTGSSTLAGRATVKTAGDTPIDFELASREIALVDVGASDPEASPPDALRDVKIDGSVALPEAGATGKVALRSAEGVVSAAPYKNMILDLRLAGARTRIEKLSLDAFSGKLFATGAYDARDERRPSFDLSSKLEGMRVEELIASQSPGSPASIEGELAATLDLRGSGLEWEQIAPALNGQGSVRIAEGVLKRFNPAGDSLRAILKTPALAGSGLRTFFDAHPQVFGAEDAPFEMLDGKLDIGGGQVTARDFTMIATDYSLAGGGVYHLAGDGEVDFQTALLLSPKLSEELVAAEPRLRFLRRRDGQVAVPLAIRGAPADLSVLPDTKALAGAAGREAVSDLLGRALGGSSQAKEGAGGADAGTGAAESADGQKGEEDLGGALLRRGLGGLLGGPKKEQTEQTEPEAGAP